MKMKKYYLLAIAVITTLFTACNSDDDVIGGEETRGVVKTEFTISFPAKAVGGTRMTNAVVQNEPSDFRGITNIQLYPFTAAESTVKTTGSTALPTPITLTYESSDVGKYGYSSSSAQNQIDGLSVLYNTSSSHLYKDVEIPIGTQTFMFYGKALGSQTNFEKGALTPNGTAGGSGTLADIHFDLNSIRATNAVTDNATQVASYLTTIANISGWSTTTNVVLKTLYDRFITMHAGSWTNAKAAVEALYRSLKAKSFAVAADQTLANNIMSAITASDALGTGKTVSVVEDPSTHALTFTFPVLGSSAADDGYPADVQLPDGAAYINWNTSTSTPRFEMLTTNNNTGLDISDLRNYVYPAELYYRGISSIKVSNSPMSQYYNDAATWSTIIGSTGYSDGAGAISATTRSVAIIDPVQYAVGRLDVIIKANETPLKDNEGTDFAVGEGSQLIKMTGVLIGGQKNVNYLFQPVSGASAPTWATTEYTIYDKTMNNVNYLTTTATTSENANKTLVLETAAEAEVKIAVEFEYSASATIPIVGTSGLIYPGTKFYMMGALKPTAGSGLKTFEQDHYTVATINVKSLKNAYNYLPDLRAPKLELGLSIDLTWIAGYSQTINIE